MQKDFDIWNFFKKKLDGRTKSPTFKEREIWWCHLGLNIGDEENGKGEIFYRPVLILKKFNNNFLFVVPLSSKQKNSGYYFNFEFKGKKQSAIMCQARPISSKRLSDKYGKMGEELFFLIRKETGKLLSLS